jgi:hypothetical protein
LEAAAKQRNGAPFCSTSNNFFKKSLIFFIKNQEKEDNFDAKYANSNRETNPDLIKQNGLMLRRNSVQSKQFWKNIKGEFSYFRLV